MIFVALIDSLHVYIFKIHFQSFKVNFKKFLSHRVNKNKAFKKGSDSQEHYTCDVSLSFFQISEKLAGKIIFLFV
jgi:hypothetical protein